MIRAVSAISKLALLNHPYHRVLIASMSGLKIRASKKSTSTVFAELSSEYLQKHNEQQQQKTSKGKNDKGKSKTKQDETDLMEIEQLKNSWLGNALEDDLIVQTKEWQCDPELETFLNNQKTSPNHKQQSPNQKASQQQKRLFNNQKHATDQEQASLKVKTFKKDLTKTQYINNSRKFLEIICNIFPRMQVQRIIAEVKQFCSKRDLNMPSMMMINLENQKSSTQMNKNQQRKFEKEIKIIQKITKDRQRKVFIAVRRIFDETLTDIQLIDNLLKLLSLSDPYIMNNQDIHKMVYNHDEGIFDDGVKQQKSSINLILDKKQGRSSFIDEQKMLDDLITAKKDFIKQSDSIMSKPSSKKQMLDEEGNQETNSFQDFTFGEKDKENKKKPIERSAFGLHSKEWKKQIKGERQRQIPQKKKQRLMNLIVKQNKDEAEQKATIPDRFEINQKSLHEIERILFKNKKIIEDNVVFKKVRSKTHNSLALKQRQDFGKNWIYAFEMPYALTHEMSQDFIDYVAKNYGEIVEYYIFPYKSMLEKMDQIMIHFKEMKKEKINIHAAEALNNGLPDPRLKKPQTADMMLEKIEKEKSLKLNKSSMAFKFKQHSAKTDFLLPEMRLYGINYNSLRSVRFEEAQSKKMIAINMIPWGCSSDDLQKAINKALKPIDLQVSYQSCILAKGYIFLELDNFYESLNACQLLNNLQFQGHKLKVQISYGSSKLYGQKFKNVMEFDHYEALVKKLKDINCFYNEIYQD